MQTQIIYNVVITSPVMSLDEFAKNAGIEEEAAKHMWKKGEIPRATMFKGRRMVNMLKLAEQCQKAGF